MITDTIDIDSMNNSNAEKDVSGLLQWMGAFPSLDGVPIDAIDNSNESSNKKVASAILVILQEFCSRTQGAVLESKKREEELKTNLEELTSYAQEMESLASVRGEKLEATETKLEEVTQNAEYAEKELKTAVLESKMREEELKENVVELKSKLQEMETLASTRGVQLAAIKAKLDEVTENAEQREQELNDTIADLSDNVKHLNEAADNYQMQIETAKTEIESNKNQVADSQMTIDQLREELDTSMAKLGETGLALRESQNRTEKLNKQVKEISEKATRDAAEAHAASRQKQEEFTATIYSMQQSSNDQEEALKLQISDLTKDRSETEKKLKREIEQLKDDAECLESVYRLKSRSLEDEAKTEIKDLERKMKDRLEEVRQTHENELSANKEEYLEAQREMSLTIEISNVEKQKLNEELTKQREALSKLEEALQKAKEDHATQSEKQLNAQEEKMNNHLEEERRAHMAQLAKKSEEYTELEERSKKEIISLQRELREVLESSKGQAQQLKDVLFKQKEALTASEIALKEARKKRADEAEQQLIELEEKMHDRLKEQQMNYERQLAEKDQDFEKLEEKSASDMAHLKGELLRTVEISDDSKNEVKETEKKMKALIEVERQEYEKKLLKQTQEYQKLEATLKELREVSDNRNEATEEQIRKMEEEIEEMTQKQKRLTNNNIFRVQELNKEHTEAVAKKNVVIASLQEDVAGLKEELTIWRTKTKSMGLGSLEKIVASQVESSRGIANPVPTEKNPSPKAATKKSDLHVVVGPSIATTEEQSPIVQRSPKSLLLTPSSPQNEAKRNRRKQRLQQSKSHNARDDQIQSEIRSNKETIRSSAMDQNQKATITSPPNSFLSPIRIKSTTANSTPQLDESLSAAVKESPKLSVPPIGMSPQKDARRFMRQQRLSKSNKLQDEILRSDSSRSEASLKENKSAPEATETDTDKFVSPSKNILIPNLKVSSSATQSEKKSIATKLSPDPNEARRNRRKQRMNK